MFLNLFNARRPLQTSQLFSGGKTASWAEKKREANTVAESVGVERFGRFEVQYLENFFLSSDFVIIFEISQMFCIWTVFFTLSTWNKSKPSRSTPLNSGSNAVRSHPLIQRFHIFEFFILYFFVYESVYTKLNENRANFEYYIPDFFLSELQRFLWKVYPTRTSKKLVRF